MKRMNVLVVGLVVGVATGLGCVREAWGTPAPPTNAVKGKAKKSAEKKGESSTGIALIEIEHAPLEQTPPLAWLTGSGETPTLRELIAQFRSVGEDKDVAGLVVRLKTDRLKATQVQEIGAEMDALRAKGKKVHLFADGYDTIGLLLGAHADEVILQAGGAVSLPGMYMEEMYLADTLALVGVKPQLVQIGAYKGAEEPLMRSGPSPQWDQNISGLLDALYANARAALKSGRKLTDAQLDHAMEEAWVADGETARQVGLIDAEVDLPALSDHLKKEYHADDIDWTDVTGEDKQLAIDASNPFAILGKLMSEPNLHPTRDTIAVVNIVGPIIDGESTSDGLLGSASVGSITIRRALQNIEDEDLIKGVLVRIDSPGGSAVASEIIWQGLKRLAKTRPVWVSVGSMAASGGYYCAVGGQKIYLDPSSIVGSIGVVGGKVALGGLYDKLKIHTVGRSRGPMGMMLSSSVPWNDQQLATVRSKMEQTYKLFESRVSAGRQGIDLSQTAAGRLFVGEDAIKLHMADKIGGEQVAIEELAKELQLKDGGYDVMDYPGPKSFRDVMSDLLGRYAQAPGVVSRAASAGSLAEMFKEVIGPADWASVRDNLSALLQLRTEPVLLTSPTVVIVR